MSTQTRLPPPPKRGRPRTLSDEAIGALVRPGTGLLLFVLAAGLVALALGLDAGWDLRNHHFHNPWAFLQKPRPLDGAPAGIETFRNPIPDLYFYGLIASGVPAWMVAFALGLPAGVAAYFFFRIARRIVVELHFRRRGLALAAISLVAFTGSAAVSQLGLASGAWLGAALVLPALFVLIREGERSAGPSRTMCSVAGLLLGLAAGLQPAALPCLGAGLAVALLCFRDRPRPWRAFVLLAGNGLLGFLVGYGYWGAWLLGRYDNPFFPYFNDVFRSEYFDAAALVDPRFRPQTAGDWLAWPLRLAERGTTLAESTLREPRLAALLLVAAGLGLGTLLEATRGRHGVGEILRARMPRPVRFVSVFTAAAYAAWLAGPWAYGSTLPFELLASLLLVLALAAALDGTRYRDALVVVACVVVVVQTLPPGGGRLRAGGGPWFDVRVPLVTPDALVLATAAPIGYLAPFLPEGARVLRPLGPYRDRPFPHRLQQLMHERVAGHAGPLYVLRREGSSDPEEEAMLAGYGLARIDRGCAPVRSNLEDQPLEICPLERR